METKRQTATGEGKMMTKGELRLAICEENQKQGGGYVLAWCDTEGFSYVALRNMFRILKKNAA